MLRNRAKKAQYPYGYPGDVFGKNSVPHYQCHLCRTKFPDDAEDGTACSKCGHPKGPESVRLKPQRVEYEPDPEVLKTTQAQLEKLNLKS